MGVGQRVDLLVKAGAPGTYLLQTLDPALGLGLQALLRVNIRLAITDNLSNGYDGL